MNTFRIKIILAKKIKKILICDRFVDSTIAYQVYGKKVEKKLIDIVHKYILNNIQPDLTFLLNVKNSQAAKRLKQRNIKNRYDKFPKKFYEKAQRAFIKIKKSNKKKYYIFDNSNDDLNLEKNIFKIVLSKLK